MRTNIIWASVGALAVAAAALCRAASPVITGLALGSVATAALAVASTRRTRTRNAAGPDGVDAPSDRWNHLIPGLEDASTTAQITACMEQARFATLWDAARTWAGGLVMWHVTAYPSQWTARAHDAAAYGAWAGDLIAAAIVDAAREDGLDAADGSALRGLGLDRLAPRLTDLRTALIVLTRNEDAPVQYMETAQGLSTLSAGDIDQQSAALFTAGIARQVLAVHTGEGATLADRIPALAQWEATRTMWHHRPTDGPYRGARPLTDHFEHVNLLSAVLLHHHQAGSTGPSRQERAYRLHRAALDDRIALLWPATPPGELSTTAEQSGRRLLEWDRRQPDAQNADCQQEHWDSHPRQYVRHAYRKDRAEAEENS